MTRLQARNLFKSVIIYLMSRTVVHSFLMRYLPLLIGILLMAPVFFFHAFRSVFPPGYAGMFTQMAEQIATAGFSLPAEIPHYGPGGIPFVYPPLAHFLFALALKLGISKWAYLRLIPPLFGLITLVPFYFLMRELAETRWGSLTAILLTFTAPAVFSIHLWAAGVVRGLALALCLTGLLFYLRALRKPCWHVLLLAGVSLGLLLTTHLLYTLFAALVGTAFLLAEGKPRGILTALVILLLALLVASPWLGTVLLRHGFESLWIAASSHRNADFFSLLLQNFGDALAYLWQNLAPLTRNSILTALALPGWFLLVVRRQFHLPAAFLFVLTMGEAWFFLVLLAGMMAGIFSAWLAARFREESVPRQAITLFLAAFILLGAGKNVTEIIHDEPEIDAYALQMAKFIRQETDPAHTYLYVGKINEAEWFPYLLARTPVFSPWGSEWKGDYEEQLQALIALRTCQMSKDWMCIETLLAENDTRPDLLIAPNQRWLFEQLKQTRTWQVIYENERYQVWKRR